MRLSVSHSKSALAWVGIGLVLLAGCGDTDSPSNVIPTRTLVPPTATVTPEPFDLTPTPTDLPAAGSLAPEVAPVNLPVTSPTIQVVIDRAKNALIEQYEIDPGEIQLLGLDRFTWYDESVGCHARYEVGYTQPTTSRGYRIIFSADGQVYNFHTNNQGAFFRCEDDNWLAVEGDPLPADPIAQSLVELTARDAAGRFADAGVSPRLTSLIAVSWPDSSMGCPQADGVYNDQLTPGYRIVFRIGTDAVIYHTSIYDFVRCLPDDEILPGILRPTVESPTE